jgi:polyisoprenyl-phosphate glycosyltransferase
MPTPPSVALLIPVFDDWDAADLLCRELDRAAETLTGVLLRIYLIDDGSSTAPPAQAFSWTPRSLHGVSVVRLRRNVGHQRAIALGLAYLYDVTDVSAVLVMDGDGEDKPEDAIALVRLHLADATRIIFAARRRRIEGLAFRAGYALYRFCHWLLTGIEVRIGNFSIVPRRLIGAIVVSSESWSH